MTNFAIIAKDNRDSDAVLLANKLGIDFVQSQDTNKLSQYQAVLILDAEKLSMLQRTNSDMGSIYVDFLSGEANHRRKFGGGKSQMLAKAVGLNKLKNPHVLDATAGLGRDAFVLACLGCKVDMVERSPIIFTLLQDGLQRANQDLTISQITQNMSLTNADSCKYISNLIVKPDIIYLDPMFPKRDKSALVKKEMRIFKEILGDDTDADKLLAVSLNKASKRVVVKRPRQSPFLNDKKPSFIMEGKANRFDVYVL